MKARDITHYGYTGAVIRPHCTGTSGAGWISVRRDGRVVDGGGLENHCTRKGTGGSNPSPSAIRLRSRKIQSELRRDGIAPHRRQRPGLLKRQLVQRRVTVTTRLSRWSDPRNQGPRADRRHPRMLNLSWSCPAASSATTCGLRSPHRNHVEFPRTSRHQARRCRSRGESTCRC